ncbi:hypothetical protein ANN_07791 [Periplaneta americana]|uniref:Uncharacterized protein n=1 Tax=Periplaneta americana TaxID=6978 RepID=A0ABQ8SZJ6_PERAM|nr:hypothetical protein ANN_07791 [Periplaneta americana]
MDRWVSELVDGWMDGWTDGWVGRWMHGWIDGRKDGWMGGCMDGWKDRWMVDESTDGWTDGWMDGRKDGWKGMWVGGWTDGLMDGWMDGWMGGWMMCIWMHTVQRDGWIDGWMGRAYLQWPPRSPDLTPCDFFLWGFIKDQVYVLLLPANLPELRDRIREAVAAITPDMLIKVWEELAYILDVCRATNGADIEHLRTYNGITRSPWEKSPTILNYAMGGIPFQSRVDIRRAVREISRNAAADGVRRLPRIWQRIVDMAGDYIRSI